MHRANRAIQVAYEDEDPRVSSISERSLISGRRSCLNIESPH